MKKGDMGDKSNIGDKGDKSDMGDKSDKSNVSNMRNMGDVGSRREKSSKGYHRLLIWQAANEFVLSIYTTTKGFPKDEIFGLTSQLRRATVSVAANIVEGHSKQSKKDFLRYLDIAKGSLCECEYYLELCCDLGFFNETEYNVLEEKRARVGYLIYKFSNSIR